MMCFKTQEQVKLSRSFCVLVFTAGPDFLYSSLELCSCLGHYKLEGKRLYLLFLVCKYKGKYLGKCHG